MLSTYSLAIRPTFLDVLIEAVVLRHGLDVGEVAPVGEAQQEVALHVGGRHEEVGRVGPGAVVAVAAGRVAVGARADVLELGGGQPQQARRDCNEWRRGGGFLFSQLPFPHLWEIHETYLPKMICFNMSAAAPRGVGSIERVIPRDELIYRRSMSFHLGRDGTGHPSELTGTSL